MPPFSLSSTLFGEVGGFVVAATFSLFRSCRSAGKVVAVVAGVRESGGLFSRKPAGGLGLHGTFLTGWVESGDVLIEDGGEEVKFVAFFISFPAQNVVFLYFCVSVRKCSHNITSENS